MIVQRLRRRVGAPLTSSRQAAKRPAAVVDKPPPRAEVEGCAEVFTTRLTEPVLPAVMAREEGEKVQLALAGSAPQWNDTAPLKAALAVTVRVAVPLWPCAIVRVLGLAVTVKPGASAVTVMLPAVAKLALVLVSPP